MPVRLRITLLFTISVFTILLIVGSIVYYIFYQNRLDTVKARLTNRANNIDSLLKQTDVFNNQLIQKINTVTAAVIRDKELQVYDDHNRKIYGYSDRLTDTLMIDTTLLDLARIKENIYFTKRRKDAVAIYDKESDIVIISATVDEPGKNLLFQLKITLWISLMSGIVISLAGGYFFAGRLLRPIKEIADEVNEISEKSLTQRIPTGIVKDEWHYLSDTLNRLLNRLQKTLDMHRRFISNASHELSTPLISISSQLEISLQRNRQADEYRNVMVAVYRDALHLSKLTQTLLEFAKTSGSDSGLEIQPVRVDEIILRLPAELVRINKNYTVLLEFGNLPAEENHLLVFGNEELLFTAVKNIVINACKYTTGNRALVILKVINNEIVIYIVDNGPGMPDKELVNIFQPFYRGDSVGSIPGFGVGLSLARRIIKLHKGRIHVASSVKEGTTFTIFLPAVFQQDELGSALPGPGSPANH
jgi:two-component system, OmpR family, sensor histidine kinase ArlS